MRVEIEKINWTDFSWAGEVSEEIAALIGWMPRLDEFWDSKGRTDFCIWTSRNEPRFDPFNDLNHAMLAANRLIDIRRVPFALERHPDGWWKASFTVTGGSAWATRDLPQSAICEAILKLGRVPDFRKALNGQRAPSG